MKRFNPLCYLLNECFVQSVFPNELKFAQVTPVYKKDYPYTWEKLPYMIRRERQMDKRRRKIVTGSMRDKGRLSRRTGAG